MANALRRHLEEIALRAFHSSRPTADGEDQLAELGVSDTVAERVLGHKLQAFGYLQPTQLRRGEKTGPLPVGAATARNTRLSGPGENVIPFEVRHGKKT